MNWIIYSLLACAIGAAVLAVHERHKKRRVVFDDGVDPTRDPERAAYTKAEAIRAEGQILQPPHGGGTF